MAATVNPNAASAGESIASPRRSAAITSSFEAACYPVNTVEDKAGSSPESSEAETHPDGSENGNASKKPAWNRPYNAAPETGLVMGAVSWPTLSESTKGSPKPPSADSLKNPNDAPISEPLVTTTTTTTTYASFSPAASASAPQKQMTSNPNPNATQHHGRPARQKSMKREGGGNLSSNGGVSHHYTHSSMAQPSYTTHNPMKSGPGSSDSSGRDHGHNNAAKDGGQRSGQQRNYRRTNSGPHLRGDGGRRDQEQDWSRRRSFNGRDPYQRGVGPSGYIRPPPSASAYIPPPIQPYGGPVSISPEMQPLYYFAPHPGMPFVAQMPPAVYYPTPDHQLHVNIINQIDYYFSNENLVKDTFLRQNMDEHGWVSIQLVANFKKVTQLTTDIQLILDVIQASTVVEIQGDKIRRREDWKRWIMPPVVQVSAAPDPQSPSMLQDTLAAHVQGLSLDENTADYRNLGQDVIDQPQTSKEGRDSSGY